MQTRTSVKKYSDSSTSICPSPTSHRPEPSPADTYHLRAQDHARQYVAGRDQKHFRIMTATGDGAASPHVNIEAFCQRSKKPSIHCGSRPDDLHRAPVDANNSNAYLASRRGGFHWSYWRAERLFDSADQNSMVIHIVDGMPGVGKNCSCGPRGNTLWPADILTGSCSSDCMAHSRPHHCRLKCCPSRIVAQRRCPRRRHS